MELKQEFTKFFDQIFVQSGLQERLLLGMKLIHANIPLHFTQDQLDKMNSWKNLLSTDPQKNIQNVLQNLDINKEESDLSCFKDILGLEDSFLAAIFALGSDQLDKNHYKEAAALFTVMIILDSFSAESYICLAIAEAALGHKLQAENYVGIALGLAPQDPQILQYIGHFYQTQGDRKVAQEFFQLAKSKGGMQ